MSYVETIREEYNLPERITLLRAFHLVANEHDSDWREFVNENGEHDTYDPAVVLIWLGY